MPKLYAIHGSTDRGAIYDGCVRLNAALARLGYATEMAPYLKPREGLVPFFRTLFAFVRQHKHENAVFLFHYPGWQQVAQYCLIPQLVFLTLRWGCKGRVILNIHDISKFNPGIRSVFIPLLLGCHGAVFTTERERDSAWRMTRWLGVDIRRKSTVIGVGCNIEPAATIPDSRQRKGVVCFGHIRTEKGIEAFLDVAERLHQQQNATPFYLIGNLENWDLGRYRYATSVMARIYRLPADMERTLSRCTNSADYKTLLSTLGDADKRLPNVTLALDEDIATITRLISHCRYALMLFPDGASMRRGSLQYVLANRCVTLTSWSDQTDDAIRRVTLEAGSMDNILRVITSDDDYSQLLAGIDGYMKAISWDNIAAAYRDFFTR